MKKIFFCLLLLPFFSSAQDFPIDTETGKATYTDVVTVENVDADQLFTRAQSFFAKAFVNSNHVIKVRDESTKTLVGTGTSKVNLAWAHMGYIHFTVTIEAKDGKYRYKVTDIYHDSPTAQNDGGPVESATPACGSFQLMKAHWNKIRKQADSDAKSIVDKIKKEMNVPAKKDDW